MWSLVAEAHVCPECEPTQSQPETPKPTLAELEAIKDRAALQEVQDVLAVKKIEEQLHVARQLHGLSYRLFLETMQDYFAEKVRIAEERANPAMLGGTK
jgi:hypothetical protein